MSSRSPLDPLSVAQVLASLVLDPTLAGIVGPYSMILIAAIGGAAAALAETKEITTRRSAFLFLTRGILASLLFTVPVSTLIAYYLKWETDWILLGMAAILSYASGKWRRILAFAVGLGKSWIINWVKRVDGGSK